MRVCGYTSTTTSTTATQHHSTTALTALNGTMYDIPRTPTALSQQKNNF